MISFSTDKLRKKKFGTNKKFAFFFNCSNWEKFVDEVGETNWWKHPMNSLIEWVSEIFTDILADHNKVPWTRPLSNSLSSLWPTPWCPPTMPLSPHLSPILLFHIKTSPRLRVLLIQLCLPLLPILKPTRHRITATIIRLFTCKVTKVRGCPVKIFLYSVPSVWKPNMVSLWRGKSES